MVWPKYVNCQGLNSLFKSVIGNHESFKSQSLQIKVHFRLDFKVCKLTLDQNKKYLKNPKTFIALRFVDEPFGAVNKGRHHLIYDVDAQKYILLKSVHFKIKICNLQVSQVYSNFQYNISWLCFDVSWCYCDNWVNWRARNLILKWTDFSAYVKKLSIISVQN